MSRAPIHMKPILALALVFAAANGARAEDFVFETRDARLVIQSDAFAGSLTEKQNGRQLLRPGGRAFAAVRKGGRLFPASAAERRGDLVHVTFGASGVDADYRISARADYIAVELAALHGDGIEELRLMQLNVPLANAGGPLPVRWDDEFAVSVVGLSAQVNARIAGPALWASVYPEFSMQGERVAIVAAPTSRFLDAVRNVERDFRLPSPTIGGVWAKLSPDVRTSYLFADLTEANADETIRYAKLAGFRYILVYDSVWSASLGSYPINTHNFPGGEKSLKAVIAKCHAAGLKVGMHMETSFVGKNDPLTTPKPNSGLLKDAESTLSADVDEAATELATLSDLKGFPVTTGLYGPASDILIDDEIIHYGRVTDGKLGQCMRGFAGTKAMSHKAGARIQHLVEAEGSYLADLKTPLKDIISDRVAGLVDRCGFDMIYFDGGDVNAADGPAWYWMGVQQSQIMARLHREVLVQGAAITNWTWHISSRGTSDDYSAVAPKQYLDYHKIADVWESFHSDFLPVELGWTGFLKDAPDHPATTPDEVEYYAARMVALNSGVSLETTLDALKANGRTEEMLKLLGQYERLRLGGAVPSATRQRLRTGEWHMTRPGEFHPIRYDPQQVFLPGEITLKNEFPAQTLKFRLQAAPTLAAPGDSSNITLLRAEPPVEAGPPAGKDVLPGSLIQHFDFPKPLDLTKHRALAVRIDVDGVSGSGEPAVLNVQLETGGRFFRDYYIDVKANGPATVILSEPGTKRMLTEFRPVLGNYYFKYAMYDFDYGNVTAMNLRWMRYPKGSGVRCRISLAEALEERDNPLRDVSISAGSLSITIPGEMKTGDYAEYWGDGTVRVFDRNGVTLSSFPVKPGPQLGGGENSLTVKASVSGSVVLTAITLGK